MAGGDNRQEERSGGGGEEQEQEEKTDGWLTTYSDMVTLLLTFFVLLFAISNVDAQKAALVFAAMSREGLSAEQYMEIADKFLPSDDDNDTKLPTPALPIKPEDDPAGNQPNPEMDALAESIQNYIDANALGDSLALVYNGEYLLLTLSNDIWFASGSAEITPEMKEKAGVLAGLIADTYNDDNPFEVVVAGHTDNVPIHTARYPSNWYVSVDRAVNFMDLLISESGLDPSFFNARGCGEYRPIASNETDEGRQANRRVEVYISLARDFLLGMDLPVQSPDS